MMYKCLHGTAPPYLADEFLRSSDLEARGRLRTASSSSLLIVCRTRLSTVGDRAFPVAAARVWNDLPRHVTSAPSQRVFLQSYDDSSFQPFLSQLSLLPMKLLVSLPDTVIAFVTYLLIYLVADCLL